jgi:hypothetical protein
MAKDYASLTQTVTRDAQLISELRKAFGEIYTDESKVFPGKENEAKAFVQRIHSPEVGIPVSLPIKDVGILIEYLYENQTLAPEYSEGTTTMTGAQEYPVSGTTAVGAREAQEAERQYRAKETQASIEKGKRQEAEFEQQQTERAERLRQILETRQKAAEVAKAKLEGEMRYVKATEKPAPTEDLQKLRNSFVEEINKVDPEKVAIPTVYENLRKAAPEDIPDNAVMITAVYAVASAQEGIPPAARETITKNWIKENPQFSSWASPLADQSKSMHDLAKEVAVTALGPDQTLVPEYSIDVSETPKPDYEPTSLGYIPMQSVIVAKRAETVSRSGADARPDFLITDLERQLEIAHKGVQGSPRGFDGMVQGYFETYTAYYRPATGGGVTDTTDWSAKIDSVSGLSDVSGFVGNLAQFGAQKAVGKVATQAVAKTGAKAALTKLTTALSTAIPVPVANWIVGYLGGELLGKVLDKIDWKKLKEWSAAIVGGLAGLIALPFIGLGAAVGVGLGATAVSMGLGGGLGGLTLGGIGSGIGSLIGAITGATLGAIGGPILAFFLGFPVVVALILFIINSGAYIVPPGGFGLSGAIPISGTPIDLDCNNVKESSGSMVNSAELIYCALSKSGMNPLLASMVSQLQKLSSVLNGEAIDALAASAPVGNHLQCIGYVSAVAGQAYDQNWGAVSNACSYVNKAPGGYRYISGTQGMGPGDVFVIGSRTCGLCGSNNAPAGSCGHIGVVVSVDGVGVSCADANADGRGSVRVNKGCFTLDDITGYISKR